MKFSKFSKVAGTAVATGLVLAGNAMAAPITLPTELTDALTSVGIVGAGVFAIAVGVKLYKWIKGAL
jgi:hypothetical protein